MALDTRDKRGSAIGWRQPWRPVYPNPDGALDQGDRQQAAWAYRGILAGPTVPPAFGPLWATAGGVWANGAEAGGVWSDLP